MKKTFTVLMMVLLAVLLFTACDNKASEPKGEDPATPVEPTYTVTFNVNGGNGTIADKTTGTDGKVSEPGTAPKRTDAVFLYWSKDKSTEFNFDTTALTEDTTLYAVWKTEFEVGDTGPAGGKIFYVADTEQTSDYVDSNGVPQTYTWKYLEAATENITFTNEYDISTEEVVYFGYHLIEEVDQENGGTDYIQQIVTTENDDGSGTNAEIGQGRYNTTMLVDIMGNAHKGTWGDSDTNDYAAKLCTDYRGGGYSDWFLPSLKELKEMYDHKDQIGGTWHADDTSSTGGYIEAYWSSSEARTDAAWALEFSDGTNSSAERYSEHKYVRAIRAF